MRRFQVLTLVLAACGGSDGPAGPSAPTTTFLSFVSPVGEYIGAGETQRYTLIDGTWVATYGGTSDARSISISVIPGGFPPGWFWYLNFAAPAGQALQVGTYETADRYPFQTGDRPGFSFFGTYRACNTSIGRFVIKSLILGPNNTISRLHATFEQQCEGSPPALAGEVSIVANPWH